MSAPASAPAMLSTVDDYLGPGEKRFFGCGFRRVGYRVSEIESTCTDTGELRAESTVGLAYPADWSRKNASRDLRPHFSTIDALVLAVEASELALTDAYGPELGRLWVRRVRISAGTKPQEDLGRLPIRLTGRTENKGDRADSVTDCRIGTMRVRTDLVHAEVTPRPGTRRYDTPSTVLGPAADRYYGEGFKAWSQEIRDVRIDRGALRAAAHLALSPDDSLVTPTVRSAPSVSMVDGFVTALQLAQVLLYDLDDVRRADSETLWMRQTVLTCARQELPCPDGVDVATWLENAERISMGGALWRTADIVGDIGGIELRSAVTHRLPTGAGE